MFLQVPLGIVQKDETKTAEVIELLDIYKKYVPAKSDGNPFPIILYCDGLSCERVDGAQKARINGGNPWHRLQMFEPCIQEWHKRLLHMQVKHYTTQLQYTDTALLSRDIKYIH
jgi:hypothetical protein